MTEVVNQKPTKTLQEKARSLFSFLCKTYGIPAEQYKMEIPKFVGEFIMQPLYKNGADAGCIAMKDEGHLVILVGYDTQYPLREELEKVTSIELQAGKLCPEGEKSFYRNSLSVYLKHPRCGAFSRAFHSSDLTDRLGVPTSTHLLPEEAPLPEARGLFLVYGYDRSVEPSKGMFF